MAVPHCFDYYRFVVSSEIRKYESSNLVLIFKIVLAIWGLLCFYINCKNFCSSSVKTKNRTII